MTRVNGDGTRRVLDAAARAGVNRVVRLLERGGVRRVGEQPGAADRGRGAAAESRLPARRSSTPSANARSRSGRGARTVGSRRGCASRRSSARARARCSPPPRPAIRRSRCAAPTAPVQVVHVDDVASALLLAVEQSLDGVYNVAADGWLAAEDADALHPRRRSARRCRTKPPSGCCKCCGGAVSATRRRRSCPYLAHPWVVANDRMKDAGWKPRHTNEEAILLASPAPTPRRWPWIAAAATRSPRDSPARRGGCCVAAAAAR